MFECSYKEAQETPKRCGRTCSPKLQKISRSKVVASLFMANECLPCENILITLRTSVYEGVRKMWFCKVYFDLWLKFWQMEQVWASTPESIYFFKSSGLDRPRNNNCLFLPSLTTGNRTTPVFWSERIIDRQATPPLPFMKKASN